MSIEAQDRSGTVAAAERADVSVMEAAISGMLPVPASENPRLRLTPPIDEVTVKVEYAAFGLPHYATDDPPDWPEEILAGLPSHKGALGDYLEHLPPGLRLARLLAAIDVTEVDDFSLVEVVAAHKRMESWSAAQAAAAAAELAEREVMNPTWPGSLPGRTRGECVAGDELAVRLRLSRLTAVRMVACGRAFNGMFQPTGELLEDGLIDLPRAQAIVTILQDLPSDVAMAAQLDVLENAPGRTLRQLQQDLAKAVIAVDPDGADARHRAARQDRRVNRPRELPDGMASVSAVLPAVDAVALDISLDAAARAAKNNGDQRTLDQLRADSLALMAHTALQLGHIGPHAHDACSCGCSTRTSGTAPPTLSTSGGTAPPAFPSPGDTAPPAPPQPSSTAPPTFPSSAGTAPPTPPQPSGTAPPTPTSPVGTVPPHPGQRVPGCCLPTVRLGLLGGGRADIRITVPLSVMLPGPRSSELTALEREPVQVAELEGYGPIPPEVARALAAGGTWRRLVTDPLGHEVLDVGRTRYQPTAAIADHVRERSGTCARPSCSAPARTCDLDHRHEWQDGGGTSVDSIDPLCKHDHRVKSIGAFVVARATDNSYAWTTATGHGYLRRTDATVITLPRRTAESLRAAALAAKKDHRDLDRSVVDRVLAQVARGSDAGGRWAPAPGSGVPEVGPSFTDGEGPPY